MTLIASPFGNESEAAQLSELMIENRLDRISLFGSIDITRDKGGLEKATELKVLLDAIVLRLQQFKVDGELPQDVTIESSSDILNPFA
jgi:hypothetical protein